MQLSDDEIFKHFTLFVFDLSFVMTVSSIIKQSVSDGNLAETSSAVSQQQFISLTLC